MYDDDDEWMKEFSDWPRRRHGENLVDILVTGVVAILLIAIILYYGSILFGG